MAYTLGRYSKWMKRGSRWATWKSESCEDGSGMLAPIYKANADDEFCPCLTYTWAFESATSEDGPVFHYWTKPIEQILNYRCHPALPGRLVNGAKFGNG